MKIDNLLHHRLQQIVAMLLLCIISIIFVFRLPSDEVDALPWTPTPSSPQQYQNFAPRTVHLPPADDDWIPPKRTKPTIIRIVPTPTASTNDNNQWWIKPTKVAAITPHNSTNSKIVIPTLTPRAVVNNVPEYDTQSGGALIGEKVGSEYFTTISLSNQVMVRNVKDFGINVGARDQFGAAQILKNVIPNPGFEAAEVALIFNAASGSDGLQVQADNWSLTWNDWDEQIGHRVGYWNGAHYQIATGPAAGRSGRISKYTHEDNKMTFYLDSKGTPLQKGDVVFLSHEKNGVFFEKRSNGYTTAAMDEIRPGTPGEQSIRLRPAPNYAASLSVPLDSLARDGDKTAGKMMLVSGTWKLEFWVKSIAASDSIHVEFRRIGENKFFDEIIDIHGGWQKISRTFYVAPSQDLPNASPGPVVLDFRLPPGSSPEGIYLDDASLVKVDYKNPTVFTDKYVQKLRELSPGILRNWGNQMGSSFDNQIAVPFARKTTGASPVSQIASNYHYSLHEFLELSELIEAEPWYVIPPTFTYEELENLIAYLSAPVGTHPYADERAALGHYAPWTNAFDTIHLEYGNEMWGGNAGEDQFIGTSVRGGERLGQIANQRLNIMKNAPHFTSKFNLVLGGQYNAPERQGELEANSSYHDTIALAPYYADQFDSYATDDQMYYPLFASAKFENTVGNMRKNKTLITNYNKRTNVAVYEVNMHTTFGNAPADVRNKFVTSLGGGLALPLHMLTMQRDLGVIDQAAFTSLQYSHKLDEQGQFVKLWGLLRDVEATGIKRPGWLGLELANQAIQGDAIRTLQRGRNPAFIQKPMNGVYQQTEMPYIQTFAFKEGNSYKMILFNLNLYRPEVVQLDVIPEWGNQTAAATMSTMTGHDINANNERTQQVTIREKNLTLWSNYELTLEPHSMTVIEWES